MTHYPQEETLSFKQASSEALDPPFSLTKNTAKNNNQQLLHSKFITHNPKAGLNPLVDAAAYLFSIIGKLKSLKSYGDLNQLHQELIAEMNTFQETAKAQGYSSEYILVSRYALSVTIDDIISDTSWGKGHWDHYSILSVYNQDTLQKERFFLILERIVQDPALYIDVMELMYICLSLGYKGHYRAHEFHNDHLEKIIHALYKRIRVHHGDYSKTLSPFPVKATAAHKPKNTPKISYWLILFLTSSIIMLLFIGLGFMLDTISKHTYEELMHIGKAILYETNKH